MTKQTTRSAIEAKARKAEDKARQADFTAAINAAIAPHIDLCARGFMSRASVSEVSAARVAMTLARSWHDVAKHKEETIAKHGKIDDDIASQVAADVDRRALERARKAWDKITKTLQYVSVREKADSNGNTYHSVKIVYTDGTVQRVGETYGYGNQWQTTVAQALAHSIEGAALPSIDATSEGHSAVGRRVTRDNAHYDVVTIARTKDHYAACDRG